MLGEALEDGTLEEALKDGTLGEALEDGAPENVEGNPPDRAVDKEGDIDDKSEVDIVLMGVIGIKVGIEV